MRTVASLVLGVFVLIGTAQGGEFARIENLSSGDLNILTFELPQRVEVDISGVGIRSRHAEEFNAYGWIINAKSREVVWDMDEAGGRRVSGSKFLRKVEETIPISAGVYELHYYVAGRDHAFEFWGDNIKIEVDGDRITMDTLKDELGWLESLSDWFDGRSSEDYERDVSKCFIALSCDGAASRTSGTSGGFPDAIIRHTKLGNDEAIRTGFELTKPMSLRLYSVFEYPDGYKTAVDQVWISDAKSGERVWESDKFNSSWAGGADKNQYFDGEVKLGAGKYLLNIYTDDSHAFESFNANPPYDPANWGVTVLPGRGFDQSAFKLFDPPGPGEPIIEMARVRNDEYREKYFRVSRPTSVRVLALGEFDTDPREFADYGWIERIDDNEMVWEMNRSNTQFAGGAHKNRMFDGTIELEKGDYHAVYTTDGSHAYRDWNASQPYEAAQWGMTLYPGDGYKEGDILPLSESDVQKSTNHLIRIVKVGDDEEISEKFTLTEPTRIHIYALGEGLEGDEMADYAYISTRRSGRVVWEMTYRNTVHAGGADKNRLFDDEILLDAGEYEVRFVTDGSHAFNDWNDDRPRDARNWGITISVAKR